MRSRRLMQAHPGARVALAVLAAAMALTVVVVPRPQSVADSTEAGPPAQGLLEEGREVYLQDCAWCHGPEGDGTQFGPTLEESGAAAADFYLRTGRMPLEDPEARVEASPPSYDDETIEALVLYVATLGDGRPIPVVEPGDLVAGRSLFLLNCAPCHSASGTGVILSGGHWAPELYDTPPTQVAEAIRLGPGAMPPFPEAHIDDEELNDLVTYVMVLGEEQVEAADSLDQFGPIATGMFVWAALVPALLVIILVLGKRAKK